MTRDRGSGTIWVLTWCVLVWFVALTFVLLGSVRVDRHRAATAADLAALATAQRDARGASTPCAAAEEVAAANDAELVECTVRGTVADITVELPLRHWPATVTARSRAGPGTPP
ncbi:flp pilus-assembly TadE/G-like family protein [Spiractinospora alimapuensis]|uniref:Rv3654c family TadE-like protein n=1 Tax=Spiractinospora alimapuensis TaxID=2820884 RepID=UPI001F3C1393|nr:Rv3654c family TadE-like protein [Spiractinospora alimapuensis]QVQ50363.1 flp pilus-assembly TadE/G-like family protein [Spiractinospora alimapuensis]